MKLEKAELTFVNEHFSGKHNRANCQWQFEPASVQARGLFGQTLLTKIFRFAFAFWVLLLTTFTSYAQKDLLVDAVLRSNGQEMGIVNKVLKDRQGYIWIGCGSGLYRYDSKNIVAVNQLFETEELPNSPVNDIAEDKKGNLWIATHEGLFFINSNRTEIAKPYPKLLNDNSRFDRPWVKSIYIDEKNNLWFGTHFGLEYVDLKSFTNHTYPVLDHANIPDNRRELGFIKPDKKNNLWIGTFNGLIKFDLYKKTWEQIIFSSETSISDKAENDICSIEIINDSLFVIGTWASGLKLYNPLSGKDQTYLYTDNGIVEGFRNIVLDIEPSILNKNELYIATDDNGVGIFNYVAKQFNFFSSSKRANYFIQDPSIRSLYFSSDKILWTGTSSGLQTHSPLQSMISYYRLEETGTGNMIDAIISVAEDKEENKVYLGTYSYGIWIWNRNTNEILLEKNINPLKIGVAKSLLFKNELLYIVTHKLTYIFNTASKQVYPLNEVGDKKYINIEAVNDTLLFFFPFHQKPDIYNTKTKSITTLSANNSIDDGKISQISCIYVDKDSNLWFGTFRNGIGVFNMKTHEIEWQVVYYKSIPIHDIYDIEKDRLGNLWFCTFRMGIFKLNPITKELINYRSFNGASINTHYAIKKDEKENLWIATNSGLLFLDPTTMQSKIFTQKDGLETDLLCYGLYRLLDNTILVPHLYGFSIVDPKKNKSDSIAPNLMINSFLINDKKTTIKKDTSISLQYFQNSFEVEYAALSYTKPQFNEYAYKLEGFHDKWINTKNNNHIYLSKIPPGDYVLHLKAANSDGVWNETGIKINILIKKPFWATWWFYSLLVFVSLLTVYLILKLRIHQIQKVQKMRNKIASDLHDDVGSALSSIKLYAGFVSKKSVADPQVSEVFSKIESTTKESLESMSDIVWSINPKNDKLQQVTIKMKTFSDNILGPLGIALHYYFPKETINISMEARRHVYLFYKEAINNIAKYSKSKNVWIELIKKKGLWTLYIKDDGIGFNIEKTERGNGMNTMKERADELNAKYSIISVPAKGTEIELSFKPT